MRFTAAMGLLVLTVASVSSCAQNGFAWIHPDSYMSIFESRISTLASEVRRRDTAVEANFQRFVTCGKACPQSELDAIFRERQRVVQAAWPKVFDRLAVDRDWGTYEISSADHEAFKNRRHDFGDQRLRNQCYPQIVYLWRNGEANAEHNGEAYQCSS